MNIVSRIFILYFVVILGLHAEKKSVRWTEAEDTNASLTHVIERVIQATSFALVETDFLKVEERDLATSHFVMYVQSIAGTPIQGAVLNIWTDKTSGLAIQVEATVEDPAPLTAVANRSEKQTLRRVVPEVVLFDVVKKALRSEDDNKPLALVESKIQWRGTQIAQFVKVRARRGYHHLVVSPETRAVLEHKYKPFPQADFSLPAEVYPIYEEPEDHSGTILPRIPVELRYLQSQVGRPTNATDPYAALKTQRYLINMYDPVKGMTEEGRAQGYWSMAYIKSQAASIRAGFPLVENSFANGGVILEGKYATVNIHPAAALMPGLTFPLLASTQFRPDWRISLVNGQETYEMIPGGTLLGKIITSQEELLARPARRLPDHDPASYLNDGFDEIQVYYAINTLMESLQAMGFSDPELSTRPFNAFLYDPDISMRNNAYYTDDTINFTTYSSTNQNYARDNSTIWHELGHGVMDRLMGDSIVLTDTGGLSEGMADFLASLVIADKMHGEVYPGMHDYRIINNTGFHLTNEVHDDGEAYGGAMDDLKNLAIANNPGKLGIAKVTDLTLEAMRLSRNNPNLTASAWFERMLFADARGSSVRARGEMRQFILDALMNRNFSLAENANLAQMSLRLGTQEIAAGLPGGRERPIPVQMNANETASFQLMVRLSDGDNYRFQYPVKLRTYFRRGALQGAIRWNGEESEPQEVTIERPGQSVPVNLTVSGTCDEVNRDDGSCVDYAYVQVWNNDPAATKPVAKKRFYLKVKAN